MLSDEERKAIDELWHFDCAYNREIKIVLNIIKKQSKEIESLKEDKEIIKRKYEDLVDENEKFLYDSAVYLMGKDDTDSKWKDKIKAKIKELENKLEYETNGWESEYEYCKEVLQSLLEKE